MFSWGRAEAPEEQRQPTRMLVKLLRRQGILMPTPITLSKESLKLKILIKGIVTCTLPIGKHVCVLCGQSLCHVQLFAAPWTVAHQAPLSMRFSRQEYWSGLPYSPPGDLPNPGIKLQPLASPILAGGFFTTERFFTWEDHRQEWQEVHDGEQAIPSTSGT